MNASVGSVGGKGSKEPQPGSRSVEPVRTYSAARLPIFFVDYLVDPAKPGASGLSDIVWDMAEQLASKAWEVHVFGSYSAPPRGSKAIEFHRFRTPWPGYRNVLGHLAIVLAVHRAIRRLNQPGIIHAAEYLSTGILAALSKLPVVLTVPGSIDQKVGTGTNTYDLSFTSALLIAARLSARRCARVIATSRGMHAWWTHAGTPSKRLILIPLGVNTEIFWPATKRKHAARQRHGPVVLNVGRLSKENGQDMLLKAFSDVLHLVPDAELHIVGDGAFGSPLREQAQSLGIEDHAIWHGWLDRSHLAAVYSSADVFAFTATTAGMPRTILEAMACGTAVVANDVPGVRDQITDGITGCIVPPGNAEALAAGIIRLLEDDALRSRIAEQGMRHVASSLSWSAVVDAVINRVYEPLITEQNLRVLTR